MPHQRATFPPVLLFSLLLPTAAFDGFELPGFFSVHTTRAAGGENKLHHDLLTLTSIHSELGVRHYAFVYTVWGLALMSLALVVYSWVTVPCCVGVEDEKANAVGVQLQLVVSFFGFLVLGRRGCGGGRRGSFVFWPRISWTTWMWRRTRSHVPSPLHTSARVYVLRACPSTDTI